MPLIPKKLRFIWFGGLPPLAYQLHMAQYREVNPDYAIRLYSSPGSMSAVEYKALEAFCCDHDILLVDVDKLKIDNIDLVEYELESAIAREDIELKKLHWVRASDILRISLLNHFGGIYLDLDLVPTKKPFGDIEAPDGFLTPVKKDAYIAIADEDYGAYVYDCEYEFMAALANHRIFVTMNQIIRLNYGCLRPEDWVWQACTASKFAQTAYSCLTGHVLFLALNHYIQTHRMADIGPLYLDTTRLYLSNKDNNWVPKNSAQVPSRIYDEFSRFRERAIAAHEHYFPIKTFDISDSDSEFSASSTVSDKENGVETGFEVTAEVREDTALAREAPIKPTIIAAIEKSGHLTFSASAAGGEAAAAEVDAIATKVGSAGAVAYRKTPIKSAILDALASGHLTFSAGAVGGKAAAGGGAREKEAKADSVIQVTRS